MKKLSIDIEKEMAIKEIEKRLHNEHKIYVLSSLLKLKKHQKKLDLLKNKKFWELNLSIPVLKPT